MQPYWSRKGTDVNMPAIRAHLAPMRLPFTCPEAEKHSACRLAQRMRSVHVAGYLFDRHPYTIQYWMRDLDYLSPSRVPVGATY